MADIVLYHHVQGLYRGRACLCRHVAAVGHTVHTPDLFDGETFETLDEGMAHAQDVGFGALLDQGVQAADGLGSDLVFAGFSLGVMPAQQLAQTRSDARGAVLMHVCLPASEFGRAWPDGVPVQVHAMDADPLFVEGGDFDAARELVDATGQAELFLYAGTSHLFADSSLASYEPDAADLLAQRVVAFLDDLG